jgi:protein TonB
VVIAAFFILFVSQHRKLGEVDITVIESPKYAPQPVRMTEPKAPPKKQIAHEVFGISPRAATSDQGEEVKAGNTVAKAPDQEVLKPGDLDSLPIPSEEYLVTKMPELRSEVRIKYPPESKKKGVQGAVVMDLLIDVSGKVREATLVEAPNQELSAAALAAAKGFQFTAAQIQDKSVAVRIRYTYRFVLER